MSEEQLLAIRERIKTWDMYGWNKGKHVALIMLSDLHELLKEVDRLSPEAPLAVPLNNGTARA